MVTTQSELHESFKCFESQTPLRLSHLTLLMANRYVPFHFHRVPLRVAHFIMYVYCTKCSLLSKNRKLQFARVTCHLQSLSSRLKLENSVGIIISPVIMGKKENSKINTERANTCNSMAARRAIYSGNMKGVL